MRRRGVAAGVAAAAALASLSLLFADWFTVRIVDASAIDAGDPGAMPTGGTGILNTLNTYDVAATSTTGWRALGAVALTPLIAAALVALVLPLTSRVALACFVLAAVSLAGLVLRVADLADDPRGEAVSVAGPAYAALVAGTLLVVAAWAARPARRA